ncbi:MAG: AAA family ATPase [Acidobacteriota bacterium]|nr:AAA family ATPase [Acidobacteriota bacterium]
MFSDVIKSALEREIVGQPRAVHSIVRGVTRAIGGLVPREGPLCAYLLMGPSGTGKTRLVQTLARFLHGSENRLILAECTHSSGLDPWMSFVSQLAPLFSSGKPGRPGQASSIREAPPLSLILIEYLERGRPEVVKSVSIALETGHVLLPEGQRGSLRNCLVFLTSTLASEEMLDGSRGIGFAHADGEEEESEHSRIFKISLSAARKSWGGEFLARLDDLVCFRPLSIDDLGGILERLVAGLNHWLAPRGFRAELDGSARSFLIERGSRDTRMGANDLVRQFRRHLEFPVADLAISGRLPRGGRVIVRHDGPEEHLHFAVHGPDRERERGLSGVAAGRVPVRWDAPRRVS